jgi:hypothetical protein
LATKCHLSRFCRACAKLRSMTTFLFSIVALIVAVWSVATRHSETYEGAKGFQITDNEGRVRGGLKMMAGGPTMFLCDSEGIIVYRVSHIDRSTAVGFGRCQFVSDTAGMRAFYVDNGGRRRLMVDGSDGGIAIVLTDNDERKRCALRFVNDVAELDLFDSASRMRLSISCGPEGPGITFFDENGRPQKHLP